jgi:predicted MFS family arabinose efflux permease
MYGGFVGPLIPALRDRVGVRTSQMALVITASHILVNAIQPVAALITTRFRWSVFLLAGPALATTLTLMGLPDSFAALAALILTAHVGIGIFHPDGLMAAHDVSGSRGHVGVPFFLSGGYLGYSLGAWVSTQWYYHYQFDGFWKLAAPGVALLALILMTGLLTRGAAATAKPPARAAVVDATNFWLLLVLGILTVTATCVFFLFLNVDLESRWGAVGIKWGGYALAIIGISGAAASYVWGWLSGRKSLFALIAIGQVACAPFYLMLLKAEHWTALLGWSVPVGMFMGVSFFPLIATASRWSSQMTPALRAGVIMGGSWGIASLVAMGCGWLTDWGITAGQFLPYAVIPMGLTAAVAGWLYLRERKGVNSPAGPASK